MLRYQALAQHGLLAVGDSKIPEGGTELIGANSFNPQNVDGYGAIGKISPVQLKRGESWFLLRDRELFPFTDDDICPVRVPRLESKHKSTNEFIQTVVPMDYFSRLIYLKEIEKPKSDVEPWIEKNEFEAWLIEQDHRIAETDFLPPNDFSGFANPVKIIIQETGRVGIEKSWDSNTKSNAYYKQFFRELTETGDIKKNGMPAIRQKIILNGAWEFSFQVEWDLTTGFNFDTTERFITMGGEQSVFQMSSIPAETSVTISPKVQIQKLDKDEVYKLLLISDTYISNEEKFYKLPLFVNAAITKFRNFISKTGSTKWFNVKGERKSGFGQSTPSYLLKRGSVFYFADEASLREAIGLIDAENSFQAIGYNYYKIETEKYHQS